MVTKWYQGMTPKNIILAERKHERPKCLIVSLDLDQ